MMAGRGSRPTAKPGKASPAISPRASARASANATPSAYFCEFVEGRRGEILDAALQVFSEKGYDGGTMRDIAARVGVTEPALYRHYCGKEALFEDLVALAGDRIAANVGSVLESVHPENLRESLHALFRAQRSQGVSAMPLMRTLLVAAPHNPAFVETFRAHVARPLTARVAALIPKVDAFFGIERSDEATASKTRVFMSLFVGHVMTSMMFDESSDDAVVVDATLAMMGWGSPPGPAGSSKARERS